MAEQIGERHLFDDACVARAQQERQPRRGQDEQNDACEEDDATGILATCHKVLRFERSAAA
jgi:hypothetical protein